MIQAVQALFLLGMVGSSVFAEQDKATYFSGTRIGCALESSSDCEDIRIEMIQVLRDPAANNGLITDIQITDGSLGGGFQVSYDVRSRRGLILLDSAYSRTELRAFVTQAAQHLNSLKQHQEKFNTKTTCQISYKPLLEGAEGIAPAAALAACQRVVSHLEKQGSNIVPVPGMYGGDCATRYALAGPRNTFKVINENPLESHELNRVVPYGQSPKRSIMNLARHGFKWEDTMVFQINSCKTDSRISIQRKL